MYSFHNGTGDFVEGWRRCAGQLRLDPALATRQLLEIVAKTAGRACRSGARQSRRTVARSEVAAAVRFISPPGRALDSSPLFGPDPSPRAGIASVAAAPGCPIGAGLQIATEPALRIDLPQLQGLQDRKRYRGQTGTPPTASSSCAPPPGLARHVRRRCCPWPLGVIQKDGQSFPVSLQARSTFWQALCRAGLPSSASRCLAVPRAPRAVLIPGGKGFGLCSDLQPTPIQEQAPENPTHRPALPLGPRLGQGAVPAHVGPAKASFRPSRCRANFLYTP